ncbi:cytochrome P450 [Streptomyces uncialis]|uniref:cytochrome P450 n=1 Tax=Streptomyces uncialis TaxID=1048205 RepID=UPI0038677BBA|nr:cytochrome P450 [Streptomyces uncialis]
MLDFDPFSTAALADPYPVYAELRSAAPVLWSDRFGAWVVTGYGHCHAAISDMDTFAADFNRGGHRIQQSVTTMQMIDAPEHTAVRRLFTRAYRAQDFDAIAARAAALARTRLRRLVLAPCFDFLDDVARPVALATACDLLGVDAPPLAEMTTVSMGIVGGMDAHMFPARADAALAAKQQLGRILKQWASIGPGPGLIADALHGAAVAGIAEQTVWDNASVFLLGTFTTTVAASANSMLALLDNPRALDRTSGIADSGVDELLRYDTAVQAITRNCVRDTALGQVPIKRGDFVMIMLGAANRDPARFASPNELIMDRSRNRHLSLGWGPHACTGASVARIVVRALLTALLTIPLTPRAAGEPVRARKLTLRYPDRLPMTFAPAPAPPTFRPAPVDPTAGSALHAGETDCREWHRDTAHQEGAAT